LSTHNEHSGTGGCQGGVGRDLRVTIAARDLPGHVTEYSQVRTFSA